jgi:BolA protein
MTTTRLVRIRERLQQAFRPEVLEVRDDSALHAGHAGARDGAGHYAVTLRADAFRGRGRIECHRLVYEALADMMSTEIHALSIDAAASGQRE